MTAPSSPYQFAIRDIVNSIVDEYARKHKPASGQLGLFEKPEERQKPLFSKKVDDEAGKWVTMRGARVFISGDDGRIMKGPKRLMGKTREQIEREGSAGKGEAPKPKPLNELGRIKGGRADNRQKKLFEELNPGFKFDEDEDVKTVAPAAVPVAAQAPSSPADEEPAFTLDSTPQPSPAKPPALVNPDPANKQGALFDTGKNTKDLKGQELLFNSDAGDLNNPKTMENKAQVASSSPAGNYTVGDQSFDDYKEAVKAASASGSNVIETATGKQRWTPGTISKKALKRYQQKKAVYDAQQSNRTDADESNPKSPEDTINEHLENDDHESAYKAFAQLKKNQIDSVTRKVLGSGFYNKSKTEMLQALKRALPFATKTASEAAQKKEEISYAEMKLRKAKENQQAHSEDRIGAPIRSDVPEIAYTDPHGEGRAEVAKAWQAEVNDAQRELDRVKGVKAEVKPTEKPKAKKQPGEQFKHRVKEDFDLAVSRIDKHPNWVEFTVHNQHPNPDFQKELIRHISGKHPELFESIKSRGKSNMGIKFAIKSLEEEESKASSPDKYSREQLLQTMNTVIDRYVRPESEGAGIVHVDKYAHPLIHAAVGAGAMALANKAFKHGPIRSVAHAAIAAAMSAWMSSAMAANGIQPAQGNQGPSSPAVTAPATPGQIQKAGNNAVNQIVNNAITQHAANQQAAATAPPSPAQSSAHSVSAAAAGKAGVPGAGGPRPLTGVNAPRASTGVSQSQSAGKGGVQLAPSGPRPLRDPGDSGGGSFSNSEHPRHPAGSSESKGGEFAPKGGAESGGSSAPEASSSPAVKSYNDFNEMPSVPDGHVRIVHHGNVDDSSLSGGFKYDGDIQTNTVAYSSNDQIKWPTDNRFSGSPAIVMDVPHDVHREHSKVQTASGSLDLKYIVGRVNVPGSQSSPRNYPDNINKPASEHLAKIAATKSAPTEGRQSRKAAWEQTQQGSAQQITEKKESAKVEKQQAKDLAKATSFNPAELEAESSKMADDIEPAGEAPKEDDFTSQKEYEKALEKHNRSAGAKQATIKKRANANLIPEIAGEHDLNHDDLKQAVDDEIAMSLPYYKRKEEARQYISKMGWNSRRIDQAEDRGIDSSSTQFDDMASEWAGLFPEIAGSDESEWVAKMWELSKEGAQPAPSAGDEDLVRRVAKRLAESGGQFGASSSPADGDSDSDFEPYTYNPDDPESTPFSRSAVVGLIVDRYMRMAGIC